MVSQLGSVNSVSFTRNAMKYLQDQELKEKSTGEEILSSLPTSAAFATAFQVIPAARKAIKFKDLKDVVGKDEFKKVWSGTVKNEETLNAVKKFAQENPKKFTSFMDKIKSKFGKKTTAEIAESAAEKAAGKVTNNVAKTSEKLLSKAGLKGIFGEAKGFFAFNMLFQLTNIIPAFKNGGIGEGLKQVGKSAAHAAGDAVAYSAGMKIGASIGTAVGGPVGAIVGGALGMVLGGVASTLVEKGIKKIVGKDFGEKQEEEQTEAQVQEIANNNEAVQELGTLVAQKIAEDQADGKISEDTQEMINELNAMQQSGVSFGTLTGGSTEANQTQTQAQTQQPATNPMPFTMATDVNQGVRNNILAKQSNGIYEINNIPRKADGSIDHSIYDASKLIKQQA